MSITVRKLIIPRHQRIISQGQSVTVIAEIADVAITSILTDPTNVPLVSIFNPSGTALVTDIPMVRTSLGLFSYVFPTTTAYPVGAYTANITVVHFTSVARIEKATAFVIKRTTTLATFTYLTIQNQSGVLWYWYIAEDYTIKSLPAAPNVLGKQSLVIAQSVTPSWLQINNGIGEVRYVYPAVDGAPSVAAVQPPIGSAYIGSPTITAVSGGDFNIALNIIDEIILNISQGTTAPSFFLTYTYLRMQDQNAVVWYVYIGNDNTFVISPTVPSIAGKTAQSIALATVPSWLQINNPQAAIRYVYVNIDGTFIVSATQPPIGTGNIGSPTFAGSKGGNFKLSLNISDEVIAVTV